MDELSDWGCHNATQQQRDEIASTIVDQAFHDLRPRLVDAVNAQSKGSHNQRFQERMALPMVFVVFYAATFNSAFATRAGHPSR